MNDDEIEQQLRGLPSPELPASWRGEILGLALRDALAERRQPPWWPAWRVALGNVFARHPVTAGVLALLWILIFLFRVTTPVDPAEKNMLAHADTRGPVRAFTLAEEIRLVELAQEQPKPPRGAIP